MHYLETCIQLTKLNSRINEHTLCNVTCLHELIAFIL